MGLTYNVMPLPEFFAVDVNGVPYANGFLYAYASGTTTPQDTYADSIGTANTNPVQLNSSGRAIVYLAPKAYSFVLKDSTGVTIWTVDPVYGFALTSDYALCGGRLTLTSGSPVTTADVTAATTLYFTPYKGAALALFDGMSVWGAFTFSEISVAVPAVANQMYDVFALQTAGVVSLEVLAWTNDTTRATAITLQNGVYVKSGATTRRYLGSFRTTTVAGQTEDSAVKRYVWNYYNRVGRTLLRLEAAASWNYTTATIRQANANTANQLDVVIGVSEVAIHVDLAATFDNTNASVQVSALIGEDSTTVPVVTQVGSVASSQIASAVTYNVARSMLDKYPAVGRHTYTWLEYSTAVGTTQWWGGVSAGWAGSVAASGISGSIQG